MARHHKHKSAKPKSKSTKRRHKTTHKAASSKNRRQRSSKAMMEAFAAAPKRRRRRKTAKRPYIGSALWKWNLRHGRGRPAPMSAVEKSIARHRRRSERKTSFAHRMRAIKSGSPQTMGMNPELRARLLADTGLRERLAALRARQAEKAQTIAAAEPIPTTWGISKYKDRQRERLIGSQASD